MRKINLKHYYPFCKIDSYIDVADDVADFLRKCELNDEAYRIKTLRAGAYYSLDRNDGIENNAVFLSASPYELYERKLTAQQLDDALTALPDKQRRRIYAHYILGISKVDIAKAEGVNEKAIRASIEHGLRNMEIILKKFL